MTVNADIKINEFPQIVTTATPFLPHQSSPLKPFPIGYAHAIGCIINYIKIKQFWNAFQINIGVFKMEHPIYSTIWVLK